MMPSNRNVESVIETRRMQSGRELDEKRRIELSENNSRMFRDSMDDVSIKYVEI